MTAAAPATSATTSTAATAMIHGLRELLAGGSGGGGVAAETGRLVRGRRRCGGVVGDGASSCPAACTGWVGSSGSPGGGVGWPDGGFCSLMRPSVHERSEDGLRAAA